MSGNPHNGVENSAEYKELLRVLSAPGPGGAVVIGGAGIGKTRLVQAVLSRPDVVAPIMRLHCSPTLTNLPYGALSPYLSSLERTDDPVEVLREVQALISNVGARLAPPIVVVEDAQFLDPESSFVLTLLVENAAITLIAIGAGRIEGEPTLFSLTESGLLSTIVVQPLNADGVRELAEQLTGGVLTEGTVEILTALTGGNPSFVKAFVHSAMAQGVLAADSESLPHGADEEGPWVLAHVAPDPDENLVELVHDMHSFLPTRQQRVLELLALGGPQPRALIAACEGGEYRHLLESGVLCADRDGLIGLRAEVHGTVLRQSIAPGRRAELHARWNEQRQKLRLAETPFQVLWALEVSADVGSDTALEAVASANSQLDYQLAWKICAVAGISEHSERGALVEAWTMLGLGRHYSARAMLMRLVEETDDPAVLGEALKLLARTDSLMGVDGPDSHRLEALWNERARTSENRFAFTEATAEHRRTKVLMDLWHTVNVSADWSHSREEVTRILEDPDLSAEGRTVALIMLADLHSITGRTETALNVARQAMSETDKSAELASRYQLLALFRVGWNLMFSGLYGEAEEFLATRPGTSVRCLAHQQGTVILLLGIGQLLQGRTARAGVSFAEAIAEFKLRDPLKLLPMARGLRQYAATGLAQSSKGSRKAVAQPSKADGPSLHAMSTGSAELADGLLNVAVLAGLRGQESPELGSFPLIEREVLALCSERPAEEPNRSAVRIGRLFDLSAAMEGPRAGFLRRLTAPATVRDPNALLELAARALEADEFRVAAEALARASHQLSDMGDTRRCGAVLRQLMTVVHENHLTPDDYVAQALSMAELTNREEEIVELARRGQNNAEIARTLTVSQRTVEGHLYRVFSKLGISERSELMGLRTFAGTLPQ